MMPTKCAGSATSERSGAATTAAGGGGAGSVGAGAGAPPQLEASRQSHSPGAVSALSTFPLRCSFIGVSTLHGFARDVPRGGQRRPSELALGQRLAGKMLDADPDELRRAQEKAFDPSPILSEKDGHDPR